ncbi:biotin--[acetyl-CoA-carboxylase] ligase [Bordetella sp. FB-8]|uniref:biotin--[acetyl-CoA-carboxylase] ligase n=1 Tax=Bordetella sp. FB-8 TaxID=1159870 RepID=UPI0005256BD6|nr:biotin--[acetyl-CoA-carboxylase] ligase [Bordetella sp. FB-8]
MLRTSAPPTPLALPAPPTLAHLLADWLPAFGQVDWKKETGSTNADLLARAREHPQDKPWLLGAHLQTSGRGRMGRSWQNMAGAALMVSFAFDVQLLAAELPALSPLTGLAACESLRALIGEDAAGQLTVKWPNDLQWGQAKLAGLLVESLRNPGGPGAGHTVVVGIGINLRDAQALSQALERPIADWGQTGAPAAVGVAEIVRALANGFHQAVLDVQREGFGAFARRYARVDALAGQPVNVIDQGKIVQQGIAQGLDAHGRLLLRTAEGAIQPIIVGEVSIRPLS